MPRLLPARAAGLKAGKERQRRKRAVEGTHFLCNIFNDIKYYGTVIAIAIIGTAIPMRCRPRYKNMPGVGERAKASRDIHTRRDAVESVVGGWVRSLAVSVAGCGFGGDRGEVNLLA